MSHRSFHSDGAHGSTERGCGEEGRRGQLAEVLLAAGTLLAGELDVEEDESEELDDSFDEPDVLDELEESEFEVEGTVLELLARESVA
ncbi:hypothetical protein [Brevibacterium aurantiacum]|uniref:hypothetical protein n=1 Tax=Brevibacterium aurantiacum TaxID=273384 RepID=UPI0028C3EAFC|nr:hypothetical protein [Brevibacterium aurantiacum]